MSELVELIGREVVSVNADDEQIILNFADGNRAVFWHERDCCENVMVEDVNGDWSDIVGSPLLVAEKRTSDEVPAGSSRVDEDMWTFYTFRTIKGSVDVRWHGYSNGYYSVSVNMRIEPQQ